MSKLTNKEQACDGSCEHHQGDVVRVTVKGWGEFNYCKDAIEEDRRRGLEVTESTEEATGEQA